MTRTAIRACTALAAVVMGAVVVHAEEAARKTPPDFTGVWTAAGPPVTAPIGKYGLPELPPAPVLPIKPAARAKIDAYKALVSVNGDSPSGWCLGMGMPGSMLSSGSYPMEIIQRPEQITIIYEAHGETRRVYFGDRNAPQADRVPGRNGYSSGRWEGDALVVETDNLVEQVDDLYSHTAAARIVERYHLEPGLDTEGRRVLVAEMTMTDPAFYSAPVKLTKRWAQVPNGRVLPYECAEENWLAHLRELAMKADSGK